MQTIRSLDIKNLIEASSFGNFVIFLIIFRFLVYFGFYASFLCNFGFLFLLSSWGKVLDPFKAL